MKKIAVAMSGGVDSSITAYLLKKQGWDVTGFFLKLKFPNCTINDWREAKGRAYLSAKALGIPILTIDARKEFEKLVWKPFWNSYLKGLTPNPCPNCNPKIKFGLLYNKARMLGFSYLATGHYARIKKIGKRYSLLRGVDGTKDQSYFLYQIDPKVFPNILFPLGDYKKSEIKKMAKEVFPTRLYKIKESQGLCFAQSNDFNSLVKKVLPKKPGNILNEAGEVIGKHEGIWFYTPGQRSGMGNLYPDGKPAFVVSKTPKTNEIITTDASDSESLYSDSCIVKKLHWIEIPRKNKFSADIQLRYGSKPVKSIIELRSKNSCKIFLSKPQRAVTPGQNAVFYKGEKVIGGGVIR